MRVQKRATPRSVEDSQRIASKELDYRIGLSGVVFKPPWGADLKRIGIERQGQSSANALYVEYLYGVVIGVERKQTLIEVSKITFTVSKSMGSATQRDQV